MFFEIKLPSNRKLNPNKTSIESPDTEILESGEKVDVASFLQLPYSTEKVPLPLELS